ncbi:uncharacterized protein [Tiliqua scincoides]|uniref:uncharacterized protein n=1 Tax=Tiliqua scincoides TaxID=71010 RepID=UPI003462D422
MGGVLSTGCDAEQARSPALSGTAAELLPRSRGAERCQASPADNGPLSAPGARAPLPPPFPGGADKSTAGPARKPRGASAAPRCPSCPAQLDPQARPVQGRPAGRAQAALCFREVGAGSEAGAGQGAAEPPPQALWRRAASLRAGGAALRRFRLCAAPSVLGGSACDGAQRLPGRAGTAAGGGSAPRAPRTASTRWSSCADEEAARCVRSAAEPSIGRLGRRGARRRSAPGGCGGDCSAKAAPRRATKWPPGGAEAAKWRPRREGAAGEAAAADTPRSREAASAAASRNQRSAAPPQSSPLPGAAVLGVGGALPSRRARCASRRLWLRSAEARLAEKPGRPEGAVRAGASERERNSRRRVGRPGAAGTDRGQTPARRRSLEDERAGEEARSRCLRRSARAEAVPAGPLAVCRSECAALGLVSQPGPLLPLPRAQQAWRRARLSPQGRAFRPPPQQAQACPFPLQALARVRAVLRAPNLPAGSGLQPAEQMCTRKGLGERRRHMA